MGIVEYGWVTGDRLRNLLLLFRTESIIYSGKLKEWVSGKKLGAMTIPKELLDSTLAADLTMMKQEGQ